MKNKKKPFLFFLSLGAIIILCLIFLLSLGSGKWDGKSRYSFVLNNKTPLVVSLEPRYNRMVVFTYPPNTMLEVPYEYGPYIASSVYRLGTLDEKRNGGLLLCKSVENTFGILCDGYFSPKEGTYDISLLDNEAIGNMKKQYFSLTNIFFSIGAYFNLSKNSFKNIPPGDLIRIWQAVRNLRTDQVKIIEITDHRSLEDNKLPDGTEIKNVNTDYADQLISANFLDQDIRTQKVTIEVVNATGIEKQAAQFSRILSNLGGNVIIKASGKNDEDFRCKIEYTDKKMTDLKIVMRIIGHWNCIIEENKGEKSQADLKITLGKGFLK